MNEYKIKIDFKSDVLVGIGEGYGTIVDSDVVLDEVGLPYIPSKRIKGIMRESAEEVNEMLESFNIHIDIDKIFGTAGAAEGALHLSNFFLTEYEDCKAWFKYLINDKNIINKQNITEQLTSLRYSTAIDMGTGCAKEHSLRIERVIEKDNTFIAHADLYESSEIYLALICQNIRRMGTKRTRGLGEIDVVLMKNEKSLNDNAIKFLKKGANCESDNV
ncbi:RAMP superfamily CRISPR-associated protein [Candidatus Acidulodesulfobacterium sp. H_13]|uniref:RAMP superfamily CRISPR-associated protein n=1 Tax=Candidatus Acidulodesulfobacterium sp. H_13 TaxID=3395470 RepID=UPI003AF50936